MIQQDPKFLIVKTSSLGDIIHTFPVISYLKNKFTNCRIDWVVESPFAELLLAHPDIQTVFTIDSKKWRKSPLAKKNWREYLAFRKSVQKNVYDYVFDLQGNVKSSLILASLRAKNKVGFGKKSVPEWPNLFFTNLRFNPSPGKNIREDYLSIVQSAFNDRSMALPTEQVILKNDPIEMRRVDEMVDSYKRPLILVCPSTRWPNKELSYTSLLSFLEQLIQDCDPHFLFSWGSEKERELSSALHAKFENRSSILPYLKLPLLHYLMGRVDLLVAMDSLPLHLCGTTQTKTLTFFGPSSPLKYRPLGANHRSLWGECPYKKKFEKRCPLLRSCKTGACLKALPTQSVGEMCKSLDWKKK